eukprot:IDg709t1
MSSISVANDERIQIENERRFKFFRNRTESTQAFAKGNFKEISYSSKAYKCFARNWAAFMKFKGSESKSSTKNTDDSVSSESMGSLVQGICHVYTEYGHRGRWNIDQHQSIAFGNPLRENDDIKQLRAAHRVKLAKIERAKTR